MCTSGSASGVRCGANINTSGRWYTLGTFSNPGPETTYIAFLYSATRPDGQADSGGPVFSLQDGNPVARGIISGGNANATCVGYNWPGRSCGSMVLFGDITTIANTRDLNLTHA